MQVQINAFLLRAWRVKAVTASLLVRMPRTELSRKEVRFVKGESIFGLGLWEKKLDRMAEVFEMGRIVRSMMERNIEVYVLEIPGYLCFRRGWLSHGGTSPEYGRASRSDGEEYRSR
jgi:hypothetical protein